MATESHTDPGSGGQEGSQQQGTEGSGTGSEGGGGGNTDRTFTQAELDQIIQSRIASERAKFGDVNELRRKAKEFDELKAKDQTEAERLQGKVQELETKAEQAERKALQQEVALAKGIPIELAYRLVGTTKEEIETDADALVKVVKTEEKKETSTTSPNGGENLTKVTLPDGKTQAVDMDEWMRSKAASE